MIERRGKKQKRSKVTQKSCENEYLISSLEYELRMIKKRAEKKRDEKQSISIPI